MLYCIEIVGIIVITFVIMSPIQILRGTTDEENKCDGVIRQSRMFRDIRRRFSLLDTLHECDGQTELTKLLKHIERLHALRRAT